MRTHVVYADTSVFGGVFDEEFAESSKVFFEQVRNGRFHLVTSAVVQDEIEAAPVEVHNLYNEMLTLAKVVKLSEEALRLQQAYIAAGIVPKKWADDALHVALATVAGCSVLLSWNFKHIVHFEKIPLYNAINKLNRYSEISIYSPPEVIAYEEESL